MLWESQKKNSDKNQNYDHLLSKISNRETIIKLNQLMQSTLTHWLEMHNIQLTVFNWKETANDKKLKNLESSISYHG